MQEKKREQNWSFPWRADENELVIVDSRGRFVATTSDGSIDFTDYARRKGNAELIEAVPDLLYELGGIHDALESGGTVTIEPGSVKAASIAAAIARTEGRAS